jgi:hypothetical protein
MAALTMVCFGRDSRVRDEAKALSYEQGNIGEREANYI